MSVIPFARTRFTPADIAAFNEIALPRLASGHWRHCWSHRVPASRGWEYCGGWEHCDQA
ncbi:hypothetical protein M2351_004145 [Azospirillum canadense]|nr:hypothetical protein [Azospirillum canadense]